MIEYADGGTGGMMQPTPLKALPPVSSPTQQRPRKSEFGVPTILETTPFQCVTINTGCYSKNRQRKKVRVINTAIQESCMGTRALEYIKSHRSV